MGGVADKVILIDGETLANLMIDHSVGVSLQRSYEVKGWTPTTSARLEGISLPLVFLLPLREEKDYSFALVLIAEGDKRF